MSITAETPLQISLGKALAGAVALASLVFGGSYFIMAQVKDDVAATRSDVAELRQVSRDNENAGEVSDDALRQSLADLTAQLQVTTARLTDVTESLTKLDDSIRTIDLKLSNSIVRQQEFEKSIVARLGFNGIDGQQIPAKWLAPQTDILLNLKAGEDPLAAWFEFLPEQQ